MNGITEAKAEELFNQDILKYGCNGLKVAVSQNVFDALVSFCYNIGVTGFAKSTLLKMFNEKRALKKLPPFGCVHG